MVSAGGVCPGRGVCVWKGVSAWTGEVKTLPCHYSVAEGNQQQNALNWEPLPFQFDTYPTELT